MATVSKTTALVPVGAVASLLAFTAFTLPSAARPEALVDAPGFTYQGIPVLCLRDVTAASAAGLGDFARRGIDALRSEDFRVRAEAALASAGARHGCEDTPELRALNPHDIVAKIRAAAVAGLSLATRMGGGKTDAWEGAMDPRLPQCGRIVTLNQEYLRARPRAAYLWAGTVVHELSHVAGFKHDGNERKGNACTVPHLLGDIAEWTAHEQGAPAQTGQFTTWEPVCSAFKRVCEGDARGGCEVGGEGVYDGRAPGCSVRTGGN